MKIDPELVTTEALAVRYNVTKRTVQDWCRNKKIGHIRAGRSLLFRPSDIAEFEATYYEPARPAGRITTVNLADLRVAARRRARRGRAKR